MEKIIVDEISHSFDGTTMIFSNVSFTLHKGSIVSILGASGSGKTTILQICAEILKQTEGRVQNSFKKSSFVFQESRLLPWQNVIENISVVLKDTLLSKKEIIKKSQEIALLFGLNEEDFKKYPKDLSGGMKQRVSFARALVVEPTLLFLDEPFSGLDIRLKEELYTILLKKVNKGDLGIIFITHDIMESVMLSDEVLIIKIGSQGSTITDRHRFNLKYEQRDNEFVYQNMLMLADRFKR